MSGINVEIVKDIKHRKQVFIKDGKVLEGSAADYLGHNLGGAGSPAGDGKSLF
jgi:hypothetical protein